MKRLFIVFKTKRIEIMVILLSLLLIKPSFAARPYLETTETVTNGAPFQRTVPLPGANYMSDVAIHVQSWLYVDIVVYQDSSNTTYIDTSINSTLTTYFKLGAKGDYTLKVANPNSDNVVVDITWTLYKQVPVFEIVTGVVLLIAIIGAIFTRKN